MTGLLSLPDEVIELIGVQVLSNSNFDLRAWCQVTRTCKRLWGMQIPESASEWTVDPDEGYVDIRGESKATDKLLAQCNLHAQVSHAMLT